jgi:hypothetical protein
VRDLLRRFAPAAAPLVRHKIIEHCSIICSNTADPIPPGRGGATLPWRVPGKRNTKP